jgi:hypothetical protein
MRLRHRRGRPRVTGATASKEKRIAGLAAFRDCSVEDVRLIARLADEIDLPAGRVLARAGDAAREFVVVLDGVAVGSSAWGRTVLLPGSCYGGFHREPHALAIETLTAVRLLVFPPRVLGALTERVPSIASASVVWESPAVSRRALAHAALSRAPRHQDESSAPSRMSVPGSSA